MTYMDPMPQWLGLDIVEENPGVHQLLRYTGPDPRRLGDAGRTDFRLVEHFTEFCKKNQPLKGLVITNPHTAYYHQSNWDGADYLKNYASYHSEKRLRAVPADFMELFIALMENASYLKDLEYLFLNDTLYTYQEVSYYRLYGELFILDYLPSLRFFGRRGHNVNIDGQLYPSGEAIHGNLEYLEFQGTGLHRNTLRMLRDQTYLPALKGLTCYMGDSDCYGWDELDDRSYISSFKKSEVKEFLQGQIFSNLEHIGVCNMFYDSEIEDWIVNSPLPLKSLSLACTQISEVELLSLLQRRSFEMVDVSDTFVDPNFNFPGVRILHRPRNLKTRWRYQAHAE